MGSKSLLRLTPPLDGSNNVNPAGFGLTTNALLLSGRADSANISGMEATISTAPSEETSQKTIHLLSSKTRVKKKITSKNLQKSNQGEFCKGKVLGSSQTLGGHQISTRKRLASVVNS